MKKLKEALKLRKAKKYLKRTGSPGHYKYIYKEPNTRLAQSPEEKEARRKKMGIDKKKEDKKSKKSTIEKVKDIIEKKQYAKIDGVTLDLQTANLISTVYGNLSEIKREVYSKMPIKQMISIALKLREKGAIK